MNDPTVTVKHMRACGYCMKGCRAWFSRYGISWADFVANGAKASVLLATGDALIEKPVALAREESAHVG